MHTELVLGELQKLMQVLIEIYRLKGKEEDIVVLIDHTLNEHRIMNTLIPFADSYHVAPEKHISKLWLHEAEIIADMLIIRAAISNDIRNYKQAHALLKFVAHMDDKTYCFVRVDKIREIERKLISI